MMRRLLLCLGLSAALLGAALSPAGADIVRGTAGSNPQLTTGLACSPTPAGLSAGLSRFSPWANAVAPTLPMSGFPQISGSRYLNYSGAAGYAHGPVYAPGAGRPIKSVSAYAIAPSGGQAVGFVEGWNAPSGSTTLVLGVTVPTALGATWKKVGFSTATGSSSWRWFQWTAADGWKAAPAATLAKVETGRGGWTWKAGYLAGCSAANGVPVGIDLLTVASSAGTRTFDFEGNPSSVRASVSATSVAYGQPVTFSASSTPAGVPLRVVRCRGVTCQYVSAAETSSARGPIAFQVTPEPGWTYGVRYDGSNDYGPSQANVPAIAVRTFLSAGVAHRRVHAGSRIQLGGQVGPCTGTTRHLLVERRVHHHWRRAGRAVAPPCALNGPNQYVAFHGHVRARSVGRWRLRVVAPSVNGYQEVASRVLTVRVTHRPVAPAPPHPYAPPPTTVITPPVETPAPPAPL